AELFAVVQRGRQLFDHAFIAYEKSAPHPPQVIEALIVRDAVEPAIQLGSALETIDPVESLDERILQHILRLIMIGHHAPHETVQSSLVLAYKQIETVVPALSAAQQR